MRRRAVGGGGGGGSGGGHAQVQESPRRPGKLTAGNIVLRFTECAATHALTPRMQQSSPTSFTFHRQKVSSPNCSFPESCNNSLKFLYSSEHAFIVFKAIGKTPPFNTRGNYIGQTLLD